MGRPYQRQGDDLALRIVEFAARIGNVVDALPDTRLGRHVAAQLIRSGTASVPNYGEACGSESRKDFVHKLGICEKELRESLRWLELTVRAGLLSQSRLSLLLDECDQLIAIIVKSIATAKSRQKEKTQTMTPDDIAP